MERKILFSEDQNKIDESVEYHAMGSYQIGEVARISSLLYDRGVDVIRELENLCHKFNVKNK